MDACVPCFQPHQGTVAGQPVGATMYPGRHQNLGRWSKLEAKGRPATSCSTHMFLHGGRAFLVPPSLSSAAATAQSPMDDECSKRVMGVAVPRDPVEIWSAPTKVPPERDTNSHGPWATLVQQQQLGSPTWALQIVSSCCLKHLQSPARTVQVNLSHCLFNIFFVIYRGDYCLEIARVKTHICQCSDITEAGTQQEFKMKSRAVG